MTKVQYYRVENHLSKLALAKKAGVTDNVIRRIENGEAYANVKLGTFKKIADALGVSIFDIIEEDLIKF